MRPVHQIDDMTPEDYIKRLKTISLHEGIQYGRAYDLFEHEKKYGLEVAQKLIGYLSLSDAFKCFFLESVEIMNTELRPKASVPLSEFYGLFVARLVHKFQSLFASERIALHGYPLHAYTLLRNIFDNTLLTSAALQKVTDFYSIEGIDPTKPFDMSKVKNIRKATEFAVRKKMVGVDSNLSQTTIDSLARWDEMFDYEVHGARLSLGNATGWLKGLGPLPIMPLFNEKQFSMFMNRFAEVGWMVCRLLPALQPPNVSMPDTWKGKWRILDDSFEIMVESLFSDSGKLIGEAMVEFVKTKFPFNENTDFPL
jgi:hypothetical protein